MTTAGISAVVLAALVAIGSNGAAQHDGGSAKSFQAFLPQFEAALTRFVNGDASLWKQRASSRSGATIMGGWGGYERGSDVAGRYDWAAKQFVESGATVKVEYLSTSVSGDLAYTVSIERSTVRLATAGKPVRMALRVTHVFEREAREWKLVHRHADDAMEKAGPKLETPSPGSR